MSRYVWNDTLKYTAGEKFASDARRAKLRRRRGLGEKVERKKKKEKKKIKKNNQTNKQAK